MSTQKEEVTLELAPGSRQEYVLAKEAMEAGDILRMFQLYEQSVKERSVLLHACSIVASEKGGDHFSSLDHPENVINAMERVALAAIQLAHDVAVNGKVLEPDRGGSMTSDRR